MDTANQDQSTVRPKWRLHWHVFFIHFPISFFVAAFTFQILHLFVAPACLELATNFALIGAIVTLIPAVWTGWLEWKSRYRGFLSPIFRWKIWTAAGLLVLSVPLITWRIVALGIFEEARVQPAHLIYLAGNLLLILGALIEGFQGGRLNHR